MKNAPLLCLMVMAGAFAGPADAIFKCTTAKGVVYQDRPCREGIETDVQIVISTGEMAPKVPAAQDDNGPVNGARGEGRFGAQKAERAMGDDSASVTKPTDKKSSSDAGANAGDDARRKAARSSADARVPMTAEQAQKTEPTAKYYTTDGSAANIDTPEQMTCESPSGEKRRFILANGKMTSI